MLFALAVGAVDVITAATSGDGRGSSVVGRRQSTRVCLVQGDLEVINFLRFKGKGVVSGSVSTCCDQVKERMSQGEVLLGLVVAGDGPAPIRSSMETHDVDICCLAEASSGLRVVCMLGLWAVYAERLDGDGISQRGGRHEMGLVSMKLDQHQRALLKDRIRIRNVSRKSPICVWRVPGYRLDLARQQREQELYVEYG